MTGGGIVFTDMATGEQSTYRIAWWQQDRYWKTREGEVLEIATMDPRHARNVIEFLRKRAKRLHWEGFKHECEAMSGPLGPRGDQATYAADASLDDMTRMDPVEWLNATPLVKALKERSSAELNQKAAP